MLHHNHRTRCYVCILVCLLLVLVSAPEPQQPLPRAEAATFIVNSLADTNDGTCDATNCTLREAITAANAAGGADVINFSVSGTITLGNTLGVVDTLTINGSGINLDGGHATNIMYIDSAATVTVNDLTFQNGLVVANDGGAITNTGTLSLINSTFADNEVTAGSSGAIHNEGTLTITNSTLISNFATGDGGAITNIGTLTITSSTFSENSASGFGGAIISGGPLTISNSTFHSNLAGTFGGAIAAGGTTTITSSTFSGNSTGGTGGATIGSAGTTSVASSIIVGGDCTGTITDQGNNLSFNAANCPGTVADPQLGLLQNNGGPTDTMLPALAGPAVDAYAAPCATATDQRGINRPQGSLCDIGATEQTSTIPTDTPVPPTDTPVPPTDTPSGPIMLVASAVCVDENLAVTISAGDGPFNITASAGVNMPVNGVNTGTTTINGPEKWDDVTVTETTGDLQSINLGQFKCRSDERPVPVSPAHRARTTNPFPTFSWTGISIANNYRVFVFDDANPATRTVDIRQNSGGPTSMTLSTPLPNGRLFWRVRGRQNRLWSLWSVRFTLFKDPPPPLTITTPIPTLDLNPPAGDDGLPEPVPTFPPPPNSR